MTFNDADDDEDVEAALIEWFASQEVRQAQAGMVCLRLAGKLLGISALTHGDLESAMESADRVLMRAAATAFMGKGG